MVNEKHESVILGRRVVKKAERIANSFYEHSRIFDHRREIAIPRLHRDEIMISNLLGRGGYSDVYEVHAIEKISDDKKTFSNDQQERRNDLATQAPKGVFAIKYLSRNTMKNPDRYINGASDLVIEAKLLSSISHPNIVTLHAISSDGVEGFRHFVEGNYFIITDKLECTVKDMIESWAQRNDCLTKELPKCNQNRLFQNSPALRDLFLTRVTVAADLAKALSYLHSKKIIFRDLKGDNIGFDKTGTLKLFDFGLAKELDPRELLHDNIYQMTGMTGTQRYMAPEVMKNMPYNLSADTYSYSIVIWEIISLKKAYTGMGSSHHFHHVAECNNRPEVDPAWPSALSTLITCGWHSDLSKRPDMSVVSRGMEKCMEAVHLLSKPRIPSRRTMHRGRVSDKARAA